MELGMDDHGRTVVAAVGARPRDGEVDIDVVLDVVRSAVERVVQQAMGIELNWHVSAFLRSDDLESANPEPAKGAAGLDWEFVRSRLRSGRPTSIAVSAESSVMRADFDRDPNFDRMNPAMYVVDVNVRFPYDVAWATRPVGGLQVRTAMSRWAMYGGGERLEWIAPALAGWVLEAAERLGAGTGYVAADERFRSHDSSTWEVEHHLVPSYRDFGRWLWGYGWATLLGPAHLAAIGGVQRLREVSDRVHELPGGRAWVDLGPDPAGVLEDTLLHLRDVLGPALRRPEDRPDGLVEL
jgi:hypothetical protein